MHIVATKKIFFRISSPNRHGSFGSATWQMKYMAFSGWMLIALIMLSCAPALAQERADGDATVRAHNEAFEAARKLCLVEGQIDELVIVGEASGGFAPRRIGAQGDIEILQRPTTTTGITNGMDEAIVDAQLANTESARRCMQDNYFSILKTFLPPDDEDAAPIPESGEDQTLLWRGERYELVLNGGWRALEMIEAAAGDPGEYLVLVRYTRGEEVQDVAYRKPLYKSFRDRRRREVVDAGFKLETGRAQNSRRVLGYAARPRDARCATRLQLKYLRTL